MQAFQQFFRENSAAWLTGIDYKEAAPQLLLQAFLQRVINGGGWFCDRISSGYSQHKEVTAGTQEGCPTRMINYQKVYRLIGDRVTKLDFIHLFVRELTQEAIVTGGNYGTPRAEVWIAAQLKRGGAAWNVFRIAPDMDHLEALDKLGALQDNPPLAKDNPKLMKLVEMVLDVSKIVSDDELYAWEHS